MKNCPKCGAQYYDEIDKCVICDHVFDNRPKPENDQNVYQQPYYPPRKHPVFNQSFAPVNKLTPGKIIGSVIFIALSIPLIVFASLVNIFNAGCNGVLKYLIMVIVLFIYVALSFLITLAGYFIGKSLARRKNRNVIPLLVNFALFFFFFSFALFIFSFARIVDRNMLSGEYLREVISFSTIENDTVDKTVLVTSDDGKIAVTVPEGWNTSNKELNKLATIAVSNDLKEQYVAIIPELKMDISENMTLSEYLSLVEDNIKNNSTNVEIGKAVDTKIDGNNALSVEITATTKNINIVYWLTAIEGKVNYYDVYAWSVKSEAVENKPVLEKVVNSFKELS